MILLQVRRASRGDVPAIVALVQQATGSQVRVDEAQVTDWLFAKGIVVAVDGESLIGVAAWQAENLLSVTDGFYLAPGEPQNEAGRTLLEAIEGEARILMCEANVVLLPRWISHGTRALLQEQGYEARQFEELHRIWREVLSDLVASEGPGEIDPAPDLMVKRLRERMVMMPF